VISRTTVIAFFTSVLVCFLLASAFNTQFVIAGLSSVQVNIPLFDRFVMTATDWVGLAPTYGVLILIGLLLAFGTMSFFVRRFGRAQILYPIGGALCFFVMIAAMEPVLGVTLVTGARSYLGWAFQCLAGAIGGWVFARQVVRG
jgi:hypothetical protein